jgi:hypothetical protein
MGTYVGKLISARIAGREWNKPFKYMHLGDLATIGRRAAVVKFGPLELKGLSAGCSGASAHIYFLIGLRNRFVVAFNWFWDYVTFQRGARLITDPPNAEGLDATPECGNTVGPQLEKQRSGGKHEWSPTSPACRVCRDVPVRHDYDFPPAGELDPKPSFSSCPIRSTGAGHAERQPAGLLFGDPTSQACTAS